MCGAVVGLPIVRYAFVFRNILSSKNSSHLVQIYSAVAIEAVIR